MRWAFEKDKILCKLIAMQRERVFCNLNIKKVAQDSVVIGPDSPDVICVVLEG